MFYWTLLFLGILSIIVQPLAGGITLIKHCVHNDVWVKCAPGCPKICSEFLRYRKCSPRKCQAGCACREGWVRQNHDMGRCIKREACLRYVID